MSFSRGVCGLGQHFAQLGLGVVARFRRSGRRGSRLGQRHWLDQRQSQINNIGDRWPDTLVTYTPSKRTSQRQKPSRDTLAVFS